MSSKKYRGKLCAYCWAESQSADHVPPRNLFAVEDRTGLVKVPACTKCNAEFSLDDEYTRLVLSLDSELADRDDISQISSEAIRSLGNPKKAGLLKSVQQSIRYVDRVTPSGLYIDRAPVVSINNMKLQALAAHIARGLYYEVRKAPLPRRCTVTARHAWDFVQEPGAVGDSFRLLADYVVNKGQERVIANGKFRYWYTFAEEFDKELATQGEQRDPYFSIWYLSLYDRFEFLVFTSSSKEPQMEAETPEATVPVAS